MRLIILFALIIVAFAGCDNLEDAGVAKRNTFVKFYEGVYNMTAAAIEPIPGGYMILGNELVTLEDSSYQRTVLMEVDENGNQIGNMHKYAGGNGKAFKYFEYEIPGGTATGYVIIGDRIYVDPTQAEGANVSISSMRVLVVNGTNFSVAKEIYISDETPISPTHPIKKDFFGGSVAITSTGLVFLGSYKEGVQGQIIAPEKQLLFSIDFALDSAWYKEYDLLGNTFSNTKSVHANNGHILWGASVVDIQGDFISSYVTIPYIAEGSEFENNNSIGTTSSQSFIVKDMQPAEASAFGYGVVGTYSGALNGSKGNMFFFRVLPNGNIVPGSDRYFDAIESFKSDSAQINKDFSSIVDEGEALCSTRYGGFIVAGSFDSSPQKGKGGKDVLLVKLNPFGDIIWIKTFGSSGDESVNSVIETSNGDILICGTNNLGDYSSIFLMKVDKDGALKN